MIKIAVSTIAKNEQDNVKSFVESCKEADVISVLDTGSTDNTVKLLKEHNAFAGKEKIEPFRFDEARNKALDLLPDDIDIVVSIDMDEKLQPGWREELEKVWNDSVGSISYWYVQYQDGQIITEGWRSKIFRKKGYRWQNVVHEIPLPEDGSQPQLVNCKGIVVEHHQTGQRDYEPLLTQLIGQEPENDNAYIQRSAEWAKKGEYGKVIKDCQMYLELTRNRNCQPCDKCELIAGRRAFCHTDIARAKHAMGYAPNVVVQELLKAVAECPSLREAWTYLADGYFGIGNFAMAYGCAMQAEKIKDSGIHSRDPRVWDDIPRQIANRSFLNLNYASN